jgi:4-amino-4-deoxy-L-arabinose transferase-like glycosyltransferase
VLTCARLVGGSSSILSHGVRLRSLRAARLTSASVLLAGILALSAAVRFWGLGFGLPHTQARPDETQIIDVTLYFLRGDFTPAFYDYPWLYMWVLTGLYLVYYVWGVATGSFGSVADLVASWPVTWEPFFLLSRALSATAGVATVFVVYRLARKLSDEATALVAALFLAFVFIHARDSHFGTTDTAMTLLIVGSVSLLLSAHWTGRRNLFALAGLLGGFATATKYNGAFLAAPFAVSQLLHAMESPGRRAAALFDARLIWFGVPFVLALAVGVPFVLADADRFLAAMGDLMHSMRSGQGASSPENGWLHHLAYSLRYGVGLPLVIAGTVGAVVFGMRQPTTAAILFAFPVAYFIVAGSFRNLFFRYMIPIVPFLVVAAAWLVTDTVRRVSASRAALALAASLVVLPSAVSLVQFDRVASATDNRVLVAEWFARHVPQGDSVLQSGSLYGYAQIDNRVWTVWTWDRYRKAFMVQNRRAAGRPDWILLQESPLPSMTQDVVAGFLKEHYDVAWRFTAFSPREGRVYDLQDAFFIPFTGFSGIVRPGPNFTLYKRTTASLNHDGRTGP